MFKSKWLLMIINIILYIISNVCIFVIYKNYGGLYGKEYMLILGIVLGLGIVSIFSKNTTKKENKYISVIALIISVIWFIFIFFIDKYSPISYVLFGLCILIIIDIILKGKIFLLMGKYNEQNGMSVIFYVLIIIILVSNFIFPKINNMYTINSAKSVLVENGYKNINYISSINNMATEIFFKYESNFGAYIFKENDDIIIVNIENGDIISKLKYGENEYIDNIIDER